MSTETTLKYYAEAASNGRHPAMTGDMIALRKAGLLVYRHAGWGHYSVSLTRKGEVALENQSER